MAPQRRRAPEVISAPRRPHRSPPHPTRARYGDLGVRNQPDLTPMSSQRAGGVGQRAGWGKGDSNTADARVAPQEPGGSAGLGAAGGGLRPRSRVGWDSAPGGSAELGAVDAWLQDRDEGEGAV